MANYILRTDSPSRLVTDKVYLREDGTWSNVKKDAKVFTAKTRATEAKKAVGISCEIITPNLDTNRPVEDAL
tara:strand:- start:118 stop:333 length:216 start_codon:yes stop_codon:yes gene_type:complete